MDFPISEFLKVVISEAKKVRNFKPLFTKLASTMKRLLPIIQEIEMLQETLDPGNKDLTFLTKTMRRAKTMVRKCSRVRKYNVQKIHSYTKKIQEINDEFVEFCQIDMPLIQNLNQLRSRSRTSLNMEEEDSNISTERRASFDEDEQRVILESFKDKGKGKQIQVDEQVAAALQKSLNMEELSLHEADQELEVAIQESFSLRHQEIQVEKRRAREMERDEQIANAFLYDEGQRLTHGSSSSTRAPLDEDDVQKILWESFKK